MRERTAYVVLSLIALGVIVAHALPALRVPGMSADEAYLHLRQAEHIRETGVPLHKDPLAAGGKRLLVTPLYDYVLALFGLVMPGSVALKVVPALLAGALVVLVFFTTRQMTQDDVSALLAAFATAIMPAFAGTINTASPAALVLGMTTVVLWQLMSLSRKGALTTYALFIILLSFAHPSVALVLLGLLFYAGLLVVGEMSAEKGFFEILLFSMLFIVWSLVVRFKDALVVNGPLIVFQNIPAVLRDSYFAQPHILDIVLLVGIVPFLLGSYVVYTFIFRERRRDTYLLIGFALAMGMLLWMGIVRPVMGVMFLGLVFSMLFGVWVRRALDYLAQTRAAAWRPLFLALIILVVGATSLWPAVGAAASTLALAPSQQELAALESMRQTLPQDAVVLTMTEEAYRVQALAHVKTVQDLDFLLQQDATQRYADMQELYTSRSKVDAVDLLNTYGITHIYVSPGAQQRYGFDKPWYASDEKCFEPVVSEDVVLLRSTCKVRTR